MAVKTGESDAIRAGRFLPVLHWGRTYCAEQFSGDLIAGVIVAIMLVPQSMAYALLAGLPPQVGLYASMLPLVVYGLLGTSRSLAVGPVAMVSLLVASSIGSLSNGDPALALQIALILALLSGLIQLAMGLLRIGFVVNFLSHPVLSAFTSAAAILIGFSQLKHLLGYPVPRFEHFYEQVLYTGSHLNQLNPAALAIGLTSIAVLFLFKSRLERWLPALHIPPSWVVPITKGGPLVVVLIGTLVVGLGRLDLNAGVSIVGAVPSGLPPLTNPFGSLVLIQQLFPAALAISLVGYLESISVAKSLASKRRESIDPDQELIALGMANLGAAFTGGYPVTGGISRSVVNFSAGARTGLASMITAGLIALTALLLTPLFHYLPQAVLAAIILVAVVGMVDFKTFRSVWRYNRADGLAWLVTFVAVLWVGVETGILYGVGVSLALLIWRTSRPHIAIVGRLNRSEIYRNVLRHPVETWPEVLAIRVDESLTFANTRMLEETIYREVALRPEVEHVVLIGTAINFIDASSVETLETLYDSLNAAGIAFHLAAIKGPVLDQLKRSPLYDHLSPNRIHLSTHDAMVALGYVS